MAWNKIKSMFVVSEQSAAPGGDLDQTLKDLEKYELPPGEVAPLPAGTTPASLTGQIDFQALYDQAGIPNTDEVEALERFLGGLDQSLPESSKTAAAKAFLGAIGKAPNDVITDAGRKIAVVRAITDAKRGDTDQAAAERHTAIAELQRQIDEHRAAIESLQKDLESVRSQCAVEEARLQGARMFFGFMGETSVPGGR
jgi:mannose-6-phosphate isomerase class I